MSAREFKIGDTTVKLHKNRQDLVHCDLCEKRPPRVIEYLGVFICEECLQKALYMAESS